jgi:hypothetical protein
MTRRALLGALAVIVAAIVAGAAHPASAACEPKAILGAVKAPFQAATRMHIVSATDSEAQYQLMLQGRSALTTGRSRIEAECATDGFHHLVVSETNTVYRAWNDALSAGRALELSRERKDCATDLRSVAAASVTNGWVLLDGLYREKPRPDSYDTAADLLRARARDLRIPLSPLGDNLALDTMVHRHRAGAFGAGASLPPYCTRY